MILRLTCVNRKAAMRGCWEFTWVEPKMGGALCNYIYTGTHRVTVSFNLAARRDSVSLGERPPDATQENRVIFSFFWMKIKQLVPSMVFGVVTCYRDIMHSFIFSHGLRLNRVAYSKCLENVTLPWIERVAVRRPCLW